MRQIFDMDNPFMRTLSMVADLLILNVLTMVCSLLVVTAGPALTALYDRTLSMARMEDAYIIKPFFRAFKLNLKKGLLLGLLFLVLAALLYFDYYAAKTFVPALSPVIAGIGVLVLAVLEYAFALLARYENTIWGTLKNAVALAIAYFPRTLAMVVFSLALWLLCWQYLSWGSLVLLICGVSLPAFVNALLLNGVFKKLEADDSKQES